MSLEFTLAFFLMNCILWTILECAVKLRNFSRGNKPTRVKLKLAYTDEKGNVLPLETQQR